MYFPADLVTFTEDILYGNFHFFVMFASAVNGISSNACVGAFTDVFSFIINMDI